MTDSKGGKNKPAAKDPKSEKERGKKGQHVKKSKDGKKGTSRDDD